MSELSEAIALYNLLRPEVRAFAVLMEQQLREREPTRKNVPPRELWRLLLDEAHELSTEVTLQGTPEKIAKEAADVGNFAMMIADVCGALEVSDER